MVVCDFIAIIFGKFLNKHISENAMQKTFRRFIFNFRIYWFYFNVKLIFFVFSCYNYMVKINRKRNIIMTSKQRAYLRSLANSIDSIFSNWKSRFV